MFDLTKLISNAWLDNGRVLEFYLSAVCLIFGVIVALSPYLGFFYGLVEQMHLTGNPSLLCIPFFVKAILSIVGVHGNVKGWKYSWLLRFCGGFIGAFIWIWMTTNFFMFREPAALGAAFSITSFVGSVRIMSLALADLPPKGRTFV